MKTKENKEEVYEVIPMGGETNMKNIGCVFLRQDHSKAKPCHVRLFGISLRKAHISDHNR